MVSRFTTPHSRGYYNRAPEFRVFISSSVRDMRREREYLVKHLFPELRALARERSVDFTESTPRSSAGGDEALRKNIIDACLDEIIGHRPFFAGIIGPSYDASSSDEPEEDSLIALEIAEEIVRNLAMHDHAIFYLRQPASHADTSSESLWNDRLAALMERIDQCGIPIRGPFATPEALCESLRIDLLEALDRIYPPGDALPMIIQDRRMNEAFAATRRSVYVEDRAMIELLDAHASENRGPLVITGASGAGKSALLAYWSSRYRTLHRDAFVIEHYVGGSSYSDHLSILRRVMAEIKLRYGISDPLPASAEDIESSALSWLAHVQQEKLVLVIDALDRLDPSSQRLAWLPEYIQPQVHLITSALPGIALDAAHARAWTECPIMPLSDDERDMVVRRFLSSNGDPFNQDQIQRFVAETHGSNPLSIVTSLRELIAADAATKEDGWIDAYLSAGEPDRLYQQVLHHREKMFGRRAVRDVMVAIWGSRRGLARDELIALCSRHRAVLPDLLATLDYSLMDRGGLLTFFHDYLRQVVEARYLADASSRREAHRRLAEYFARQPFGARMIDELLWQLRKMQDYRSLLGWIGRLDVLMELCRTGKEFELLRYWGMVGEHEDMGRIYREALRELDAGGGGEMSHVMIHFETARILLLATKHDAAEEILQSTLANVEVAQDESVIGRIRILNMLGEIYQSKGVFAVADRMFNRAWTICCEYLGETDSESVRTLHHLATQHYRKGNLDSAVELLERVVALRQGLGTVNRRELAAALNDLGAVWFAKGNNPKAEALIRESLKIRKVICGAEHPDRLEALNNLGAIAQNNGDLDQAERIYRDVLQISERAFGPSHPTTALYINNLAHLVKLRDNLHEAEDLYMKALAIIRKNYGNVHPKVANLLLNLGTLYRSLGNYEEAEHMLRESLAIRSLLFGAEHVDTARAGLNLAFLFKDSKHFEKSRSYYEKYLNLTVASLGTGHPFVKRVLSGYGMLLEMMRGAEGVSR